MQRLPLALVACLCLAVANSTKAQTTYTWFGYDNTTPSGSIVESWSDATQWDVNGVFVSDPLNELMFFNDGNGAYTYADGSTRLEQEGTLTVNGVPSLSMGTLTLDGRGPNNANSTFVIIGDNTATWTIGNGTSGTINLNSISGGGGDRYVNYTVNPNIALNGNLTVTGSSGALRGATFTGNFTDGGSGYGITKSGNSRLTLSGSNSYSGSTLVSGGSIRFDSAGALSGSTNLTLSGGTAEMSGNFTRTLGSAGGEFQITGGNSGLSAVNGRLNITFNNDAAQELVWGSASFNPNQLTLNNTAATDVLTLNNDLDLNAATRTIRVDTNKAILSGNIRTSGGTAGITKVGGGTLELTGANTYNGNTTITQGTVSIETSANAGVGGSIVMNGGTLGIRGTSLFSLSGLGHSVTLGTNSNYGFDIVESGHLFGVDQALAGSGRLYKYGRGSLVLDQANTFTGETQVYGGGNLILDYSSQDNSKLSDTNRILLGGTTLTLSGGSHAEDVLSTTITDATHNTITRDTGSATINLNTISKGNRSTLHFSEAGIATTDTLNNASGILGAFATVGSHWATNSTNGADGSIIAYSSYTAMPTSGYGTGTNYQLLGSATLTGGGTLDTLRIEGTADDQTLNLGGNLLRVSSFTTGNRGGILYAGGANDSYTISNGSLQPSNGNGQSLLINTYTGKLTIDANLNYGSSGLTKTGEGILVIGSGTNTYTGQSDVMQGALVINGTTTASPFTVKADARIGGSGTIGGNLTLVEGADFIFNPTDPLIVSGLVSLDDTFGIDNLVNEDGSDINWSLVTDGTYVLIDNGSDFSNIDNFGAENAVDIGGGRTAYFQNGSLQLVVIPEPSSLLLVGLSGFLLMRRRR